MSCWQDLHPPQPTTPPVPLPPRHSSGQGSPMMQPCLAPSRKGHEHVTVPRGTCSQVCSAQTRFFPGAANPESGTHLYLGAPGPAPRPQCPEGQQGALPARHGDTELSLVPPPRAPHTSGPPSPQQPLFPPSGILPCRAMPSPCRTSGASKIPVEHLIPGGNFTKGVRMLVEKAREERAAPSGGGQTLVSHVSLTQTPIKPSSHLLLPPCLSNFGCPVVSAVPTPAAHTEVAVLVLNRCQLADPRHTPPNILAASSLLHTILHPCTGSSGLGAPDTLWGQWLSLQPPPGLELELLWITELGMLRMD